MAYWHKPAEHIHRWVFPHVHSKVAAIFEGADARRSPFKGYFLRWEGEGEPKPMSWKRDPAGWFKLQPREPPFAWTMKDAKAMISPLLTKIADGSLDSQFDRHPYRLPDHPEAIKEIENPTYMAKARIVRHKNGQFQVGYLVYAPDGKYLPASTPSVGVLGWEWGVARSNISTFADDLPSAEHIATIELDEITKSDQEIKLR